MISHANVGDYVRGAFLLVLMKPAAVRMSMYRRHTYLMTDCQAQCSGFSVLDWPIVVPVAAMPDLDSAPVPEVKRRRLRVKTSVGHLSIAVPLAGGAVGVVGSDIIWKETFMVAEELDQENPALRKAVYLVTLPHPRQALDGVAGLREPASLTHEQVVHAFLDAVARPVSLDPAAHVRQGPGVQIERMVVFKEKHAPDSEGKAHVHYHVAMQLSNTRPFLPVKRALRSRYNLASHWSCSHIGYWSAVRYGFMPTLKKQSENLDPQPRAWSREGQHPPLFESSQEANTAAATRERRERKVKAASAAGRTEPRASELDLYGVIVREGFRNTADDQWAHMRLQQYLKQYASPALFHFAFKTRSRLPALIDDVWAWETVNDDLALLGQRRWQRLLAACGGQCLCQARWRYVAEWSLQANGINPVELCTHICHSLNQGRCESLPVVVLMGRAGGEGKSFFLAPLKGIFGTEYVQASPQPGSFPLMGLETKRIVLLDDWDFASFVLPYSTQLLWYEGKAFPITRPQNKEYSGHLLYKGSAPIFITCKEKALGPVIQQAERAHATGAISEETMLVRRLKVFSFTQRLPLAPGIQIPECSVCFAQMLVHYAAQAAAA